MKKYALILILFLGVFSFLSAQDERKFEYCQANASTGSFSSTVRMDAEGRIPHELSFFKYIKDEKGNNRKFPSAAEFINFMSEYQWEFVQFFPSEEDNSRINILFKRAIKAPSRDLRLDIKKESGE